MQRERMKKQKAEEKRKRRLERKSGSANLSSEQDDTASVSDADAGNQAAVDESETRGDSTPGMD